MCSENKWSGEKEGGGGKNGGAVRTFHVMGISMCSSNWTCGDKAKSGCAVSTVLSFFSCFHLERHFDVRLEHRLERCASLEELHQRALLDE